MCKFKIDLSDTDRNVHDTLAFQVARHPSESRALLVTRVLAYALEFTEGIAFSRGGVSDPEEPAIAIRDLTGAIRVWIDVGMPDAARLHKASKAAPRVVVYTHKDPAQLVSRVAGERIHRAEAIELYAIDRRLIDGVVARLQRRMEFAMSVSGRELFLSLGTDSPETGEMLSGMVVRHPLA